VITRSMAIDRVITEFQIHRVLIALPDAIGSTVRDVTRAAADAGAEVRIVPGLSAIIGGRVSVRTLRHVQIEDLLRRAPVETDMASIRSLAEDHTVLITGAGGSIGSELARQLATLGPRRLVLLGRGENSIFEIERELAATFPDTPRTAIIGDVRDRKRLRAVFDEFRPDAVFHAAAHKHVPLMEADPAEAISNNVAGTWNVADAAVAVGTRHFVLISTDKAVRPTSAMGASKRAAEMVVQSFAARAPAGVFVSVRFGNVLGSRGSVVPTFLRQIEAGGPITITHPEMRRYFMTIPEAVRLVLHAGARGRNGDVFVLDMGEPVRISDLATDLIRLSGLEVGRDIEIIYTGIRPGEKLYEEPFFDDENAVPTDHPKILRARGLAAPADADGRLSELMALGAQGASPSVIRAALKSLLPDYTPHAGDAATPPVSSPDELPKAVLSV
jgi:FlaA1/EpsC-like NDP-sugar epimerase